MPCIAWHTYNLHKILRVMNNTSYCYFEIENSSTIWVQNQNKYLILDKQSGRKLMESMHDKNLIELINEIWDKTNENRNVISSEAITNETKKVISESISIKASTKYYKFNEITIEVHFTSQILENLIHPKFAHLEITNGKFPDYSFSVAIENHHIKLKVNGKLIGKWTWNQKHFFQGKFSMEFIQNIYSKPEDDWIAVLHGSAVYKNGKCVLLLGESGKGKSTALSLLMAHGFTCIADDFIPISSDQKIYTFPSAISVKESSLAILSRFYPFLEDSKVHHFNNSKKIVRYLPPVQSEEFHSYFCKELIFIEFDPAINFTFKQLSKSEALSRIIPDSWISTICHNVNQFFNWFTEVQCYHMSYSDNEKMIAYLTNRCENEL